MSSANLYNKFDFGYGSGLDEASQTVAGSEIEPKKPSGYGDMGKGAISAMNAGGSPGQIAASAGLMGIMSDSAAASAAGPYALAGGLALSMYEQKQKAEATQEQARVQEAEQRKANVQAALNQALGATRQLGV